jgi:CBS domain-containing protein
MVEHICGAIPVVSDRDTMRPVGMITDRDITCRTVAGGRNPLELKARIAMTEPAVTLPLDATLEECCHTMEREEIRRVIVVDRTGRLRGIVSQADVARCAPEEETAEVVKELSLPNDVPSRPAAAMPRGRH